jgi:tetratricopeptide (TPR) repeat protein
MQRLGSKLKIAWLLLACFFLHAQTGASSADAMKTALLQLKGRERLATLLDLANSLEVKEPNEALNFTAEGIALARQEGDKEKETAFLTTAAFCCTQTGDFATAIDYGKRALVLGTEIGNKDRVAKAHNVLGIAYTFIGAYSQALDESTEALRIREEQGQENAICQAINLIGVVYHHSGQYEKAIGYYQQILKRMETKPDPRRLILTKLNMGYAQYKLGRLAEALENHQEALALAGSSKETIYVPYTHLNLGLTYSELKQFGEAKRYLQLAKAEYLKQGQRHGLVQVLNAMARLHMLSGDFAGGITRAREAGKLAKEINARDDLKSSYELMSDLYGKLGNVAASYRYFKLATLTKDSLYSIQESNKIAEASMKLVTLKKDNEIESLKREKAISALEYEKQRYFSVIFISSICFLATIVLILGGFNKRMRQTRKSLEKSNEDLASTNAKLQDKIHEVKTLSGLLPICGHCKKIRDDEGYWNQLEGYISERTSATFSHGICPQCREALYPEMMERLRTRQDAPQNRA